MLFNSYIFIFLFFPLTLIGYYGLNHFGKHKAALAFLTAMSMWFYGYNNIYYLIILIVSILANYALSLCMNRARVQSHKRIFLCVGILLNIGILFYFKYYDFFIENLNVLFRSDFPLLRLVLPLGISFYTFQQLSYVIDSYKGECDTYGFLEYTAYVSFFPQLIAGPIVYHSELIPQFRDAASRKLDFRNLSRGIYAFSLGLAKKVLIADTFSKVVAIGYDHIADLNTPSVILVMVCYSLQIYFDFSGYCDMAYGMSYMLGIKLPFNFNSPYKACSISDFWDRWHMTLTRFFTRYVYIPLGGNRCSKAKNYLNVLIVFLVSGLWHGANWTFIIWGLMHGILSVLERIFRNMPLRLPRMLKVGATFLFVTFAWSLFRADSLSDAGLLWTQLFCGGFGPLYQPITDKFGDLMEISFLHRAGLGTVMTSYPWIPVTAFTLLTLTACFTMKNTQEKTAQMKLTNRKILVVILLMLWSILSLSEISEFLYFNF
ncbi:peptidoglycan O-acetyltransferase [Muribaculaceae bacterium]|nr:peptidoglycan O-acetyltransferase [Lachnospiraceae bacterium]GFI58777.1 peptidoglycan O-acetyltransferase [Muribaculaceae bacterium]